MPTRELTPTVEAKTSDPHKVAEHKFSQETSASRGIFSPQLVSQSGGSPLPRMQAASLSRSNTSSTSHSSHYVLQMQRRYGNRHVQRMLNVGREGDADERRRKPLFESTENPIEDEPVLAKSEHGQLQASSELQQKLNNSKGGGKSLPKDTRSSLESGFGVDFNDVSIHSGPDAEEMNKGLGSHAFTYGSNIYFNEGKYDPESSSAKHLLAHESTHVVQQGEALPVPKGIRLTRS